MPFGFLNLEENMWFQFMSFVCLGLFTTEFVGQFAIEGLQPSRTPAFAEPNVFEAFGVVMFTYAFIVTVPSWVNEKKPAVSVKKVMWTSALTCSLLQLAFGLLDLLSEGLSANARVLDLGVAPFDPGPGLALGLFGPRRGLAQPEPLLVSGAVGDPQLGHAALTTGQVAPGAADL